MMYNINFCISWRRNDTQNMADNNCASIFISQVTKRQSAQADVGFFMWPSAIVLSCWLVSNPHVLQVKSIVELGVGCGLVGITAAHSIAQKNNHESSVKQEVIITNMNKVVLENIAQNIHLTAERVSRISPALGSRPPPAFSKLIVFTLHT